MIKKVQTSPGTSQSPAQYPVAPSRLGCRQGAARLHRNSIQETAHTSLGLFHQEPLDQAHHILQDAEAQPGLTRQCLASGLGFRQGARVCPEDAKYAGRAGPPGPPATSSPRETPNPATQPRFQTESRLVSEAQDSTGTNRRTDGSHADDAAAGARETVETGPSRTASPEGPEGCAVRSTWSEPRQEGRTLPASRESPIGAAHFVIQTPGTSLSP